METLPEPDYLARLNASGLALNPAAAGFFVNPIRQVPIGGVGTNILYFNPATNEILRG
jgi:hypothetical protein